MLGGAKPMIDPYIVRRDDKLLKREAYIRRARYVCLGLIPFSLFCFYGMSLDPGPAHEEVARRGPSVILFLLVYTYFCTLRIRHIESIKAYRSADQQNQKAQPSDEANLVQR